MTEETGDKRLLLSGPVNPGTDYVGARRRWVLRNCNEEMVHKSCVGTVSFGFLKL